MNVIYQLDDNDCQFPPAENANEDGLLAFGGDLSPERIIVAYTKGIFPWYSEGEPYLWWSLDPRMIMRPDEMRVSKSLKRLIRSNKFEVRIDTNYKKVMMNCASPEVRQEDGTWITDEMLESYCTLHEMGIGHSFETYLDGELVGGLYGISIGKVFYGESMFHKVNDASKVAFWHLTQFLQKNDFKLIDCQQETSHLTSLGAYPVPRNEFIKELTPLVNEPSLIGNWGDGSAKLFTMEIKEKEKVFFRRYNLDRGFVLDSE